MPTDEATDLIHLVRDLATKELQPRAAQDEATETFPRDLFTMLGRAGVLGLPYPEEYGGGGQPYEVYLQVIEEIARVWASVGVGVSVHALSCFGLVTRGTEEQRQRWLPDMLGGDLLGAYCLSEPHAGSDPAAMTTTATRSDEGYVVSGTKAWVTHGGQADFYKVMARTSDDRNGISCFLVPGDADGLSADQPERKMGLTGSATTTMRFERVRVDRDRLLGDEGDGSGSRWPGSTRDGSASPPSRPASPRAPWTTPSPTPRSARPSARRSSTTRGSRSCSPTWRRPSSRPVRRTCPQRGCATRCPSAPRPRSSWSPRTTP